MNFELSEEQTKEFKDIFRNLVKLFFEKDLSLVEINPLVLNGSDNLVCLDGKINIDSNALFRQDEILELRDISQEEEKELRASEWDLNYVSLEGNIGCLVNGAGLAMATMDIIKLAGDEITIDDEKNTISVALSDDEIAERKAAWVKPPYKFQQGVLYKYIKSVATASEGCVTDSE